MKIGLGIDTGGTYTDAVLYDFQKKRILHSAKALTTKEDLAVGILNALDALPGDALQKADVAALSTTLATNACVEDKGWHAKLVFLGMDETVIEKYGGEYGIPMREEIYFGGGGVETSGRQKAQPDWDAFAVDMPGFLADADAVAVVEMFGCLNPASEKKAKELISGAFDMPVVCGHELFADLNAIKRAASTVLNARLIPIIQDFIRAIRRAFAKRGIGAPIVIVRSDCTLMTSAYTAQRPVDTLLCGPAASVLGGMELTGEGDCIIVDMGGTTTDIAIVENGEPQRAKDGVDVGKWKTFVKAVQVDTIALGGDSRIRFSGTGELMLGPMRVMPLCMAAAKWPQVTRRLEVLKGRRRLSTLPLHEFLCLAGDVRGDLTQREKDICDTLSGGPMMLEDVAKALKIDVYNLKTDGLEQRGIVIRAGLTPTDLMHIRGDFNRYDAQASQYAAEYAARMRGMDVDALTDMVYERIRETIYISIAGRLIKQTHAKLKKDGLGDGLETLIRESWRHRHVPAGMLDLVLKTHAVLVGLGGPIHIFLDEVADALGTRCVIPKSANVANALGAVVGQVTATADVTIRPDYDEAGLCGYAVLGETQSYHEEADDAVEAARRAAMRLAKAEAARRGAAGRIAVTTAVDENSAEGMVFEITVSATAAGNFGY